jgi:hypothetical protein
MAQADAPIPSGCQLLSRLLCLNTLSTISMPADHSCSHACHAAWPGGPGGTSQGAPHITGVSKKYSNIMLCYQLQPFKTKRIAVTASLRTADTSIMITPHTPLKCMRLCICAQGSTTHTPLTCICLCVYPQGSTSRPTVHKHPAHGRDSTSRRSNSCNCCSSGQHA